MTRLATTVGRVILGVDPGTRITGYGVVTESGATMKGIAFGVIKTGSKASMPERLKMIADGLAQVMAIHHPTVIALEEAFFAKDAKAALKLGQTRGAIMLVAAQAGIGVAEYAPRKIKQTVTGYGAAEKNQVESMVRKILGIADPITPVDAADALAVAVTHLMVGVAEERLRAAR